MFRYLLMAMLIASAGWAQSLTERIANSAGDAALRVETDTQLATTLIEGRRVTVEGPGAITVEGNEIGFFVRDGGHLVLDGVSLRFAGGGDAQPLIFLTHGGRLTLRNCVLEGGASVAVFARGGQLEIDGCRVRAAQSALALGQGAEATLRDLAITGGANAIWLREPETDAALENVVISDAMRGLTVEDAATVDVRGLDLRAISEVGVLVAAAQMRGHGLNIEQAGGFGLYAVERATVDLDGITIGPMAGQAVTLIGAGQVRLEALSVADAGTALVADGGSGPVTLTDMSLQSTASDGGLIEVSDANVTIIGGTLEGAGTGIAIGNGVVALRGTQIGGQPVAGVYASANGAGEVTLENLALTVAEGAIGIFANREVTLRGARIVHLGRPLSGDAITRSVIEGNMLFGAEGTEWGYGLAALNIAQRTPLSTLEAAIDAVSAPERALAINGLGPASQEAPGTLALFAVATGEAEWPARGTPLGTLSRIGPNETRAIRALFRDDFPLQLAPGRYVISGPGGDAQFEMAPAGQVLVDLGFGPGPYARHVRYEAVSETASRIAGHDRGPGLALRPAEELRALLESAWPGYRPNNRVLIPRPGASADAVEVALQAARAELRRLAGRLADPTEIAGNPDLATEVANAAMASLEILEVVGERRDADWLIRAGQTAMERLPDWLGAQWVSTGIRADIRLGLSPDGPAQMAFQHVRDNHDVRPVLQSEVVLTLAEAGHGPAVAFLRREYAQLRGLHHWTSWSRRRALAALMPLDDPLVTALSHDILRAYETGDLSRVPEVSRAELAWTVPDAFLIVAARGVQEQRAALDVGLPDFGQALPMAVALADPADYFRARYHIWSEPLPSVPAALVARAICEVLGPRDPLEVALPLLTAGLQQTVSHFNDIHPRWGGIVAEMGLPRCRLHAPALSLLDRPDEGLMREGAPATWQHAVTPQADYFGWSRAALDHAPESWRAQALELRDPDAMTRSRMDVVTTRHDTAGGRFFPDGDRRSFLEPVEEDPRAEAYWLAGQLDLRMIERDGALYAAVRLAATGVSHKGLAGMIGRHPDILAANLAGGGQGMVRAVILRDAQGEVTLPAVASAQGVMVFGPVPPPESSANLYLDVEMGSGEGQTRMRDWTVRFPLYRGADAWRRLHDTGSVGFGRNGE